MKKTLSRLLEEAAKHKMTPEEIEAQRRSWVVGELMIEYPEMTHEEAIDLYEKSVK